MTKCNNHQSIVVLDELNQRKMLRGGDLVFMTFHKQSEEFINIPTKLWFLLELAL